MAKARLADVQASQRRIVATSDSERRRIERDLHDGAQQRLVSVAFHLKVALAGADPSTSLRLAAAESRIREALGQLRRLAHGIFPSVLADEGLASALDELIAASNVPTTLDVRTRDEALCPDQQLQRVRRSLPTGKRIRGIRCLAPMPDIVAAALKIRRSQRDRERRLPGEIWQQAKDMPSLIFTGRYGTPIDPRTPTGAAAMAGISVFV